MKNIKDRFQNDVKEFTIDIKQDCDGYRHLTCSNNGSSNQRFDIVTYPYHLVISGDMGCAVFSRIKDMFGFFNNKVEDGINPSYWGEKLESLGDGTQFSIDSVMNSIDQRVDTICEDIEDYFNDPDYNCGEYTSKIDYEDAFRQEVTDYFMGCSMDEYRHITEIDEFESDVIMGLKLDEAYEWIETSDFSFRFLWQCYAIVWAIERYNKLIKERNELINQTPINEKLGKS